ncbi:MAG TPA: sulfurtransferase [Xanthobacteraceae bacterium]|nr:sulfurtransferase [Xanthobacteraceae bacterium]
MALPPFFRALASIALAGALSASASAQQGPLVDAEWLSRNLDNPNLRVFEVSVDAGVYERGHIPGAVNLRWHSDLVDTVTRDIVGRDRFENILENAGITKNTTVVLYGDNNNWFAAWGAWVFAMYGIDAKLLDGGRKYWESKGLPLDNRTPGYAKTNIDLPASNANLRARLPDVLAAAQGKTKAAILDIRGPDEFSGKLFAPEGSKELSIRAGHVPGARNVPWNRAVDPATGKFLPKDQLKKLYADVGIDGSQPIITYCRIGERSSHTWFALARILGYGVKNYDGSWTEYGNAVGVPITNASGTVWQSK